MAHPAELIGNGLKGPVRKISMAETTTSKSDLDKGFDDIKREVIEGRNLIIKTDNLLKTLHSELKAVGKQQEEAKKRQWVGSAVAYAIIAILCVTGAVLVSNARTASAGADRERLEKQVTELQQTIDKQKAQLAAREQASAEAQKVYTLMTTLPGDERLKGVDALMKLDVSLVSSLEKKALDDRAALLRSEIGQAAFERGKSAFRRTDMAGTIAELSRFLAMNPPAEDLLDASFFLGAALHQQKKHADAVPHLQRFVTGDKRSKQRDYGMLLLAGSLEATGQYDKGADVAREAIGNYPNSEFLNALKNRLSAIKRAASGGAPTADQGPAQQQPAVQQAVKPQTPPAQ